MECPTKQVSTHQSFFFFGGGGGGEGGVINSTVELEITVRCLFWESVLDFNFSLLFCYTSRSEPTQSLCKHK